MGWFIFGCVVAVLLSWGWAWWTVRSDRDEHEVQLTTVKDWRDNWQDLAVERLHEATKLRRQIAEMQADHENDDRIAPLKVLPCNCHCDMHITPDEDPQPAVATDCLSESDIFPDDDEDEIHAVPLA